MECPSGQLRKENKSVLSVYKPCSQIHNLCPPFCSACPQIWKPCVLFREQGQGHFNCDCICQISPMYRDLWEDLMLYCVFHLTFHSFHCVTLYLLCFSLQKKVLSKSVCMFSKSVGTDYKSESTVYTQSTDLHLVLFFFSANPNGALFFPVLLLCSV